VELQVALKIDYVYPPTLRDYDAGTISHYFKMNPITAVEEDLTED
jgi:hypothetical protein